MLLQKDWGLVQENPQNKLDISAITWNDGITIKNTGDFNVGIFGDANRTSAGGGLLNLAAKWNAKEVAGILFQAGLDTTNKDDGDILLELHQQIIFQNVCVSTVLVM
jgi:hypothetical protein